MSGQQPPELTHWYNKLLAGLSHLPKPIKRWVVAFSGGLDSHVLLHLLVHHSPLPIDVVHVNHQLQDAAWQWEQHCQMICDALKLTLHIEQIDVDICQGQSLEAAARAARYQALAKYVDQEQTALLTAHHADDQAETVLLQLCRGAGVEGLSAMPAIASFSKGYHIRPLLDYERIALLDYANAQGLLWIDDPSNAQLRFDRNFIRHEILKPLQARWPRISQTLSRSSRHCHDSSILNTLLAKQDLNTLRNTQMLEDHMLPLKAILAMPVARQHNVIRFWLKTLEFPTPSTAQLNSIMHDVCAARVDAAPVFCFSNKRFQLRRYQGVLYALRSLPVVFAPPWQASWDLKQPLLLPKKQGYLCAQEVASTDGHCILPRDVMLTIKPYKGSERFRPINSKHTHLLKKCVQQWQIPPWVRQQLLLCYCDDQLRLIIRPDTLQCYVGAWEMTKHDKQSVRFTRHVS